MKITKVSQAKWEVVRVEGAGYEIRFFYRNRWHTVCDLYATPLGNAEGMGRFICALQSDFLMRSEINRRARVRGLKQRV